MDLNIHQLLTSKSQHTLKLIISLIQSTGEPRVQLTQLKIKPNADHAGPSQLLLPLKELILLPLESSFHFQNNNLLIVILPHMVATEDGNQTPSFMLNQSQKILKVHTFTLLWPNLARNQNIKDKFKYKPMPLFQKTLLLNLWLQLLNNQFQSLLKPTQLFSNNINQVF